MNEMIIYTLQQWKGKFNELVTDQEIIELANEFFNDVVPVILAQLVKDDTTWSNPFNEEGKGK